MPPRTLTDIAAALVGRGHPLPVVAARLLAIASPDRAAVALAGVSDPTQALLALKASGQLTLPALVSQAMPVLYSAEDEDAFILALVDTLGMDIPHARHYYGVHARRSHND